MDTDTPIRFWLAGDEEPKARKGARVLGHLIHPMLIAFPLGLLGGAVGFDILWLTNRESEFATVSYWMLGAGLIGGIAAAVFGLWDWCAIPEGTRAKRIGATHGLTMVITLGLFCSSWFMRRSSAELIPNAQALAASFLGLGTALFGGWLGGELIQRLGVGVDPRAQLNAPNSLSPEGRSRTGRTMGEAAVRPR